MKQNEFIAQLLNLCDGPNKPDESLYISGKFPKNWVVSYLRLLKNNRPYWNDISNWPRDIIYCFYRIGFHVGFAYQEWCRNNNETNYQTENELNKVRLFTEGFICGADNLEWGEEQERD